MKKIATALCLGLVMPLAGARETNEVQELRFQLQQMREHFDKVHAEDRALINQLIQKMEAVSAQGALPASTNFSPLAAGKTPVETAVPDRLKRLDERVDQVVEAQKKSLPGEFNPAIGLVGETIFGYRSKGSDQTGSARPGGFDIFQRSVELNAMASVDPFAKAWIVANASADPLTGEAALGVEEAVLQTTSLPGNLTLTAGRFFGEFGRLGCIHDHELPFVNRPQVLDRYIGGETRTDGAQVNWLLPTEHYVSLTLGAGDQFGGDSPNPNNPGTFRSAPKLNGWGRLSTYFDLAPSWQLEAGTSGLWNPATQDRGGVSVQADGGTLTERERRLAGLDFKLSYVPLRDNQFSSSTWGTEVLYSDNRYRFDPNGNWNPANPFSGPGDGEHLNGVGSLGFYSYVSHKWSRQWSAGFLYDWVQAAWNHSDQTSAYSPFITFAFSHWNQLRLQYTHTDHNAVSGFKPDDAVYLQWAWIIGAHSHGWTQR